MKNNKKGFTLIELLVVIAIIGLLSTLAVVSLNSARQKARDARRMSDLKQISTAMELYYSQHDAYPATGVCNAAGVIAVAVNGTICPSGNAITDGTDVFLNSIPDAPGGTGAQALYLYGGTSLASTYCLSVQMEVPNTDYFVCSNGSCFIAAGGCPVT